MGFEVPNVGEGESHQKYLELGGYNIGGWAAWIVAEVASGTGRLCSSDFMMLIVNRQQ